MDTTLLILAAGMGSRFGGLKQIAEVGPNGEAIIDYSLYDAVKAGFKKIVFVIRREFEDAFKQRVGNKLDGVEVHYVYQEMDKCIGDFQIPEDRVKPWGTGHAILVTDDVINEPFAVINADDFYGSNSFKIINNFLSDNNQVNETTYAMVGYILKNTLSEHGHVSRGICDVADDMLLKGITEKTKITKAENGAEAIDENGNVEKFTGDELVSMNLWGFHPSIFNHLKKQFAEFLQQQGGKPKSEFYIPSVVDSLINSGQAVSKVLKTDEQWFGVTYSEDMEKARQSIKSLIEKGVYPEKLWG